MDYFIIIFIYTIILIFILILINILYNKYTTDCSDWPKGLNNTFLEYNSTKYGCQIIFPSRCPYPVFKNILDYTKFVGKECKKFGIDAKQKILKLSNSPFINDSVNLRLWATKIESYFYNIVEWNYKYIYRY